MTITIENFCGFETGGLDEVDQTVGSPDATETGVVNSGAFSCRMAPAATPAEIGFETIRPPPIFEWSAKLTIGIHINLTDLTPGSDVDLFWVEDDAGASHLTLRLKTNGDLAIINKLGVEEASATPGWSVNTWHLLEMTMFLVVSGFFELTLDDDVTFLIDTSGNFSVQTDTERPVVFFGGADNTAGNPTIYYDDFYGIASDGVAFPDRLGDAAVFKYQNVKNSNDPDRDGTGGADSNGQLHAGTWNRAGETPVAETATNPEYTSAGAGAVDCDAANGFPEGPSGDSRLAGNIVAAKGVSSMKRSGGAGTAHFILLGNDVDGTTRSPDINPTQSFAGRFFITELASIVPTASEHFSIGFETDGAQDYECREQWAMLLQDAAEIPLPPPTRNRLHVIG
ncbi:hypothetical protein LCGC14_0504330 [marine sediment metagenome]|uniref:Uncharacterized protein n=1 Tax=marine sediment metagenome TaxID=412755 RepID=A0A0F9VBG2_9ZZZZ